MSRNLRNLIIFCSTLGVALSCASPLKPSEQKATLKKYHKLFKAHHKEICPSGTEDEFNRLLKRYRGLGNWVPELSGDVDFITVEKLLPEMEKKLKWIQTERSKLMKRKRIPKPDSATAVVIERMRELLSHKKGWETLPEGAPKKKAGEMSLVALKELRVDFKKMVEKISFLTNYSYPTDHLKNRKIYDEFKGRIEPTAQQIANYSFFYRRLLEDGAYSPEHTANDSWLRTALDTVTLELERPMMVLDEDLRYDLEYVIGRIQKELDRGKKELIERLGEWEERTSNAISFYKDLVDPDNREKARALIKEKNQATLQLKEWVYTHQTKSWLWWSKQDETMKSLFAIDTILYNEVGNVDSEDALERMDVAQVVYNRKSVPLYRTLDTEQDLYKLLRHTKDEEEIQSENWLNILYRQGEFSFTYYYMLGSVKAFCPDLSPTGKKLQKENLEIALALLRNPRVDFPALRYFSRASMPGRINMASVWEDYIKYPERAGLAVAHQAELRTKLEKGELDYLYKFSDPKGIEYQVYQDENKIYVARFFEKSWIFYSWRNPQYFTYFTLR